MKTKTFTLSDLPEKYLIIEEAGYFYVELRSEVGQGEYGVGKSVHQAIADFYRRQSGA